MTHENLQSEPEKQAHEPAFQIVPTTVAFQSGGAIAIEADGTIFFVRDSGERVPFCPARRAVGYNIATHLEPSHQVLHIHRSMSGVLNVDSDGKLSSVFGPSVHPFLPADTVVAFFGRIELDDGSAISFDHQGHLFEIPRPDPGLALPDMPHEAHLSRQRDIDYRELCRRVNMARVLDAIGWKPISRNKALLLGHCPIHSHSDQGEATFLVNLLESTFRCGDPDCSQGNQLDLYVAVTGLPRFEAATRLCEKTGTQVPWIS